MSAVRELQEDVVPEWAIPLIVRRIKPPVQWGEISARWKATIGIFWHDDRVDLEPYLRHPGTYVKPHFIYSMSLFQYMAMQFELVLISYIQAHIYRKFMAVLYYIL